MTQFILFLFGLTVGSFLNVCIHRLPKEKSVVWPGSSCPKCKQKIVWYDNIPLVSFFILGAKCRHCKSTISWRYPIVELTSGVIWVFCWNLFGATAMLPISLLFLSLLLVITVTDLETGLIPDEVTFSGLGAGILISIFYPALQSSAVWWSGALNSILGALMGGALIYITGVVGKLVFRKDAMGDGDVKLMAMIGCFLGWEKIILVFFTAPFLALPLALFSKYVQKKEIIPYGPFLAGAAAIHIFLGNIIWQSLLKF